jgi:hypothetical protein
VTRELHPRTTSTDLEAEAAFVDAKRPAGTHVDQLGEAVLSRLTELLGDDEADA